MTRYDTLGRRIPEYDRSAVNKKGAQTRLKKDKDVYKKMGQKGRGISRPGYFGTLKQNDPEKLKEISQKAVEARKTKAQRIGEGKTIL